MNNDKDFLNDPLFKDLRKFAAKQAGPDAMPAELFTTFRAAKVSKIRSKWIGRSIVGVIFVSVALPSLAAAHVLPTSVAKLVQGVVHVIAAPVRVVASVITNNPAPTNNQTAVPTPSDSPSPNVSSNNQTLAPAPVSPQVAQTPVAPSPKVTHEEESHKKESSEGSKKESGNAENKSEPKKSEVENEGGRGPTIPGAGSSGAPTVGGSGGETGEGSSSSGRTGEKSDG